MKNPLSRIKLKSGEKKFIAGVLVSVLMFIIIRLGPAPVPGYPNHFMITLIITWITFSAFLVVRAFIELVLRAVDFVKKLKVSPGVEKVLTWFKTDDRR